MTVTDRLPLGGGDSADLDPYLDRAARWATDLAYRDLPPAVRRAARAQLASTVGAAIWTTAHPLGEPIREAVVAPSPGGDATFLAGRELWPASRPGDRTLHVLAVEPAGITGSVSLARLARSGRIREHPAVGYATGETATVRADDGLPIELDGTPVATPVETARVSVVPGAVEVAYPSEA